MFGLYSNADFLETQEEARLLIESVRQYELCRVGFPIAVLHEEKMQSVVNWTRAARRSCNLVEKHAIACRIQSWLVSYADSSFSVKMHKPSQIWDSNCLLYHHALRQVVVRVFRPIGGISGHLRWRQSAKFRHFSFKSVSGSIGALSQHLPHHPEAAYSC